MRYRLALCNSLRLTVFVWATLACVLASTLAAPPATLPSALPADDPAAGLLIDNGIKPDAQGLADYFRSIVPNEENRKLIASLVEQLGADDFNARETATKKLIAMPIVPQEDLQRALKSDDPEVRLRAETVVARRSAGNVASSICAAACRFVQRHKLPGSAGPLLEVLPCLNQPHAVQTAREALKATARPEDADVLRAAIRGTNQEVRAAAIGALAAAVGQKADAELRSLLEDAAPLVRLAAATALADHGDRACLNVLGELLSNADPRVRQGASTVLRALTGHQSDYIAYTDPKSQKPAIDAWLDWIKKEGPAAQLKFPLKTTPAEIGRTLACLYQSHEVVEFDLSGKETLRLALPGACPWACEGLSDGHRLVALYNTHTLVEFDAGGKEIWRRADLPRGPISVQRLDNGNTVVACNQANKVVEVSPDGRLVWELDVPGNPGDAMRLENGNTLICYLSTNRIAEVDAKGAEVWGLKDIRMPRSAQRLDNDNTLVCESGASRVVEYDRAGREVWSQGGLNSPFVARQLPGGTILIAGGNDVREIDRNGKILWQKATNGVGLASRY